VNTAAVAVVVVAAVVATNPFGLNFKWSRAKARLRLFVSRSLALIGLSIMSEQHIEVEGSITTVLPGTMFRVELDNKHLVLATICGKMRKRWVRLIVGDRVKMEMSPYDLDKARITWRLK
jgi:translation initiation factor IF-1